MSASLIDGFRAANVWVDRFFDMLTDNTIGRLERAPEDMARASLRDSLMGLYTLGDIEDVKSFFSDDSFVETFNKLQAASQAGKKGAEIVHDILADNSFVDFFFAKEEDVKQQEYVLNSSRSVNIGGLGLLPAGSWRNDCARSCGLDTDAAEYRKA